MIALSAGHYPKDPGKGNNRRLGIVEHFACAKIVDIVAGRLAYYNISNEIVPTGTLRQKVRWINRRSNLRLAVEIHLNNLAGPRAGDYMCSLFISEKGKHCARVFNQFMRRYLPFSNEYIFKRTDLYFLKKTKPVAVIIEPLFADRYSMARFLKYPRGHEVVAESIFRAIEYIVEQSEKLL